MNAGDIKFEVKPAQKKNERSFTERHIRAKARDVFTMHIMHIKHSDHFQSLLVYVHMQDKPLALVSFATVHYICWQMAATKCNDTIVLPRKTLKF